MDLTGYRQSETTEPSSICAAFDILHLLVSVRDKKTSAPRKAPCEFVMAGSSVPLSPAFPKIDCP
jgi:hypothetical protein